MLFLLSAEVFAVVHPLDLAAHSNGDVCKICLSVAAVSGAAPVHVVDFTVVCAEPSPVIAPSIVRTSVEPVRQSARGPPLAS